VSTGRHPRLPPADLDAVLADEDRRTYDELTPVAPERLAVGSDDFQPTDAEGWQWSKKLRAEVAEVRTIATGADAKADKALGHVDTGSKWLARGVKILGGATGLAGAIFAYWLTCAREKGHAEGVTSERESQWVWVIETVRRHDAALAAVSARVDSLVETFRLLLPAGVQRLLPPVAPPSDPGEP
jgi:hypothetical protein